LRSQQYIALDINIGKKSTRQPKCECRWIVYCAWIVLVYL